MMNDNEILKRADEILDKKVSMLNEEINKINQKKSDIKSVYLTNVQFLINGNIIIQYPLSKGDPIELSREDAIKLADQIYEIVR
ncbi:MAG: hypothetical protein AMQ22_02074 [Candidatus Methanofastidiosum methylothiophilum]|uniref:Uncharacterized protein n=1 Tax=Candidatus Methanofastidiosum methylothiophilum TaxID=1705564 RepID=A0A150IPX1_9EURY|nr:MAG: hypothetical protein AMQ22_02074 [Candidatus Methanofastidiosum methylthiophilus]